MAEAQVVSFQERQPQENVNIMQSKEGLSIDFQKWITDAEPMRNAFYFALCGWIPVNEEVTYKFLNETRKELIPKIEVLKDGRILNEAGATWLYYKLLPAISQLITTSKMTPMGIYRMWNARLLTIILTLSRLAYFRNENGVINPYQFKPERIHDLITTLDLSNTSKKGEGGYTLNLLATSISTATLIKHGIEPPVKNEGLISKLRSGFKL